MSVGQTADYDSPWKEALARYLRDFLALALPKIAVDIDWSRQYIALETELRQIAPDAEIGRRLADGLFQVWLRDGADVWVLIHVEVQGQPEADFAERMYVYHSRIWQIHHKTVESIAILADDQPDWRPTTFISRAWRSELRFQFATVKLLAYADQEAELVASRNPFGLVILAHLSTRATVSDAERRKLLKTRLTRSLLSAGYDRDNVIELFRLIDWFMQLPQELDQAFWREVQRDQEAEPVRYITSVERHARELGVIEGRQAGLAEGRRYGLAEGRREGLLDALERLLVTQHQTAGAELAAAARREATTEAIEAAIGRLAAAAPLAEVRGLLIQAEPSNQ